MKAMKNMKHWMAAALLALVIPAAGVQYGGVRLVTANPFFIQTWTTSSHIDFRVRVEKQGPAADHEAFVLYTGASGWQRFPLSLEGEYGSHLTFTGRLDHVTVTEIQAACRMPDGSEWREDDHYWISPWAMNYPPYTAYTLGAVGGKVALLEAERTYTIVNGWPCVGLKGKIAVQELIPALPGAVTHDAVDAVIHMGGAMAVVPAHHVSTKAVGSGSLGHVQVWEFDAPWTLNPAITWQFWEPLEFDIQREWTENGVTSTYVDDNFALGYRMVFGQTDQIR